MGWFDVLTGRKPPDPGVAVRSATSVKTALLALDRDTAPFKVRPAAPGERGDLVAEWRIVDAQWYAIFAKAGLKKSFTVVMRLDEATHEVRALDRTSSLSWSAGYPQSFVESEVKWGRQMDMKFGAGIGFTETLAPGVVYSYRFSSSEITVPLQKVVAAQGWTWRAIAFGRL